MKTTINKINIEFTHIINRAEKLKTFLDETTFNTNPSPDKWSIAQTINHLNITGNSYVNQMESVLKSKLPTRDEKELFTTGFLMNLFIKSLSEELKYKFKSPKGFYPTENNDIEKTFREFKDLQVNLITLLQRAKETNFNRIKIQSPITSLLKMSLSEAMLIQVNHQNRHLKQAEETLKQIVNKE